MCKRLPLGCLLRDESTSGFYLVIKSEKQTTGNVVYYLCCIYDPRDEDPNAAFKYYFTVDEDRVEKYTVLNTNIIINKDGNLRHILAGVHEMEVPSLSENEDFMLRYIKAVRNYSRGKNSFVLKDVIIADRRVNLERKTSFLEKVFLRVNTLGCSITWRNLLYNYLPVISDKLDERDFVKSISNNCYYCTTHNDARHG